MSIVVCLPGDPSIGRAAHRTHDTGLRWTHSGVGADITLIASLARGHPPNDGVLPDVATAPSWSDAVAGVDIELEAVQVQIRARNSRLLPWQVRSGFTDVAVASRSNRNLTVVKGRTWPSADARVSHRSVHCARIANVRRAESTVSIAVVAFILVSALDRSLMASPQTCAARTCSSLRTSQDFSAPTHSQRCGNRPRAG